MAKQKRTDDSLPATLGDRVRLSRTKIGMSQGELARRVGLTQPTISSLERNESATSMSIGSLAHALGVSALWLETGLGEMHLSGQPTGPRLVYDGGGAPKECVIELLPSRGSCGGNTAGKPDIAELEKTIKPIIKDQAFFARFGVDPGDVFAIIADGDGGASFIVHGDTVLFRTCKDNHLVSGIIYALDTPDGPRIKRAFRRSDGHVILSCDNPDKVRYPDEDYTAAVAANLRPLGSYLYRQG